MIWGPAYRNVCVCECLGALVCLDCDSPLRRIIMVFCWKLQRERGEGGRAPLGGMGWWQPEGPKECPLLVFADTRVFPGSGDRLSARGLGAPGLGRPQAGRTGSGHLHTVLLGLPVGFIPRVGALGPWCPVQQGEKWWKNLPSGKRDTFPTRISPHANRCHIMSRVPDD